MQTKYKSPNVAPKRYDEIVKDLVANRPVIASEELVKKAAEVWREIATGYVDYFNDDEKALTYDLTVKVSAVVSACAIAKQTPVAAMVAVCTVGLFAANTANAGDWLREQRAKVN